MAPAEGDAAEDLTARLELLTEEAQRQVDRGEVQAAVELLKDAYEIAGGRDGAEAGEEEGEHENADGAEADALLRGAPGDRLTVPGARASVCLVLCAVLSKAQRHDEALGAARAASSEMESGWKPELLSLPGAEAAVTFAELVCDAPAWFSKAVEVTLQAKEAIALELEFMSAEGGLNASLPPGLRTDVEKQHLEASLLSRHLLPRGHAVRAQVERARQEWVQRVLGEADGSTPLPAELLGDPLSLQERATASDLVSMLTGQPVTLMSPCDSQAADVSLGEDVAAEPDFGEMPELPQTPSSSSGRGRLPRHERLYQGLPPVNIMTQRRRRQHMDSRDSDVGTSRGSVMSPGGTGPSPMNFGSPPMSPSAYSTMSAGGWNQSSWSARSATPGELYYRSLTSSASLPSTPSWSAQRRTPGFFTMTGVGGKSTWALRSTVPRHKFATAGDPKPNPFEDWIKAVGNNTNLSWQVMQTEPGAAHFQQNLKTKSHWFRHGELKETPSEALHDGRVFFCETSMRVHRKMGRAPGTAPDAASSPQAMTSKPGSRLGQRESSSRQANSLSDLRKKLSASHGSTAKSGFAWLE